MSHKRTLALALGAFSLTVGCSPSENADQDGNTDGASVITAGPSGSAGENNGVPVSVGGSGSPAPVDPELVNLDAGSPGPMLADGGPQRDPNSCDEAVQFRTYLGCEFYPTVLGNVVVPEFDFTVIVANASEETAEVSVEGPNDVTSSVTLPPGTLAPLYLPWVQELKGPDLAENCTSMPFGDSVISEGGAYRVTSSRPIAAYQFNPLQFRSTGGPPGKVWSCDPGFSSLCECNSYSNDASLLLPKNALTDNYIAFTWRESTNYIAVTATEDDTEVAVQVGATGEIIAGAGIDAAGPGDIITFTLNRGDVAELVAADGADLSGTQVQAQDDKPIQLMSGSPSTTVPDPSIQADDHIEEIIFPAEAVGRDYVVTVPTGPDGQPARHVVRLYGHAVTTTLSYFPAQPDGAPDTLDPGTVAEFEAEVDFQVQGSEPFGVGSFLVGGDLLDPDTPGDVRVGDPSQTLATTVQQYRDKYVFVAPPDYTANFADIVAPSGTVVTLNGSDLDPADAEVLQGQAEDGTSAQDFDIYRVELDPERKLGGVHRLTADVPVGMQVVGYGRFTSYQYPGGLNLNLISDPPPQVEIPR